MLTKIDLRFDLGAIRRQLKLFRVAIGVLLPQVAGVPSIVAPIGRSFRFQVPPGTFHDPDDGNNLPYEYSWIRSEIKNRSTERLATRAPTSTIWESYFLELLLRVIMGSSRLL